MAVFTEIAQNTGPSVTNASAEIATYTAKLLDANPNDSIFLEHYDRGSYHDGSGQDSSWAVVTYQWEFNPIRGRHKASTPEWKHTTPEAIEELYGVNPQKLLSRTAGD